ncbi:MAG: phage late control D family protein [Oscillospiraceae bacterium]
MTPSEKEVIAPQCEISVGGALLKKPDYLIESVDVRISAGTSSNSCDVTLLCEYDNSGRKLSGNALSKIVAGKKVLVKLGYKQLKKVFMGYINSVSVEYSSDGIVVSFSCLDARGLLMGNTSWQNYENESISQIITKLLNPVQSYTDGVQVSVAGKADKEYPMTQRDVDDFSYICNLAKVTNSSFCMTDTKLRFVKNIFKTAKLQESYSWGKDILSFSRTVELAEQLGSVKVSGNSPDTIKDFSATAKPPAGAGKSGAQLCPEVKAKEKEINSSLVKDQSEAQTYAEAVMFESAMKLCSGSATVLGNQKLSPGGIVKFSDLDPKIDGQYYIQSIQHKFSAGGFLTVIGFSAVAV